MFVSFRLLVRVRRRLAGQPATPMALDSRRGDVGRSLQEVDINGKRIRRRGIRRRPPRWTMPTGTLFYSRSTDLPVLRGGDGRARAAAGL